MNIISGDFWMTLVVIGVVGMSSFGATAPQWRHSLPQWKTWDFSAAQLTQPRQTDWTSEKEAHRRQVDLSDQWEWSGTENDQYTPDLCLTLVPPAEDPDNESEWPTIEDPKSDWEYIPGSEPGSEGYRRSDLCLALTPPADSP